MIGVWAFRRSHAQASAAVLLLFPSGSLAQRYTSSRDGFSLQPPMGWKRDAKQVPAPSVGFFGPTEKKYTVNVLITAGTIGKSTLESMAQDARKGMGTGVTRYDERKAKVAGELAYVWRLRRTMSNGMQIEQRQLVSVHKGRGIVVTLSALASTIKKYDPAFDAVMASIKWDR